jgi:hypothetical protein
LIPAPASGESGRTDIKATRIFREHDLKRKRPPTEAAALLNSYCVCVDRRRSLPSYLNRERIDPSIPSGGPILNTESGSLRSHALKVSAWLGQDRFNMAWDQLPMGWLGQNLHDAPGRGAILFVGHVGVHRCRLTGFGSSHELRGRRQVGLATNQNPDRK